MRRLGNPARPILPGRRDVLGLALLGALLPAAAPRAARRGDLPPLDVRAFGAAGNGVAIDSPAFNKAIDAAAAAGGGAVIVPAGTYACHSIRLRSFVALVLAPGATILAAPHGGFDPPEPCGPWAEYEDFGHSHWHNSLVWGDGVHDVAILGPGLIWGRGLSRGTVPEPGLPAATAPGAANKTIALRNCRNVILRDFAIREGGHFGLLATGVDNLTVDNLRIDTNRDGMDIDGCRNVRITKCSVNSPTDDGICLKSSLAPGTPRPTEDVTISDCYVTGGYAIGSLLDATYRPFGGATVPTGRIKLGTESNGGFRNITISNCVFENCRGFALETVDGGAVEDIVVTGVTMRGIRNAPFFLRLGARMRGAAGRPVGTLRRVIISNLTCEAPRNVMPAIIAGIPGHPIEDVSLRDIYLVQQGGGTPQQAAAMPEEGERLYPEPSAFGPLPAQGLFARHVRNLEVNHLEIASRAPDARAFVWLGDVDRADFFYLRLPPGVAAPAFRFTDVHNIRIEDSRPVADAVIAAMDQGSLR